MKTRNFILKSFVSIAFVSMIFSCNPDNVDPALILDEALIPEGYHQIDNPSIDALTRLEELKLKNPDNHYYYLERENQTVQSRQDWLFPQKELKIEYVDSEKTINPGDNSKILGLIVKKITGDWKDENYTIIDKHPVPANGMKALYTYVAENLKYPEEARKMGIEGKVFIEFVVDKDGKLIDVKSVKGIGAGCDEEAIRVLKEAPNWIPGTIVDMPVKVRMILPITYKLS